MLIRSLVLTTLLAFAGPLLAADDGSPLDIEKGRARPLIVIAPSTVEVHRRNIMRKVGLHKVADLTRYAIRNLMVSV